MLRLCFVYERGYKMKKILALLISLSMAIGFAGCTNGNGAASSPDGSSAAATTAETTAATSSEPEAEPVALTISCAASLTEAMTELGDTYMDAYPNVTVTFNFGSSGSLQQQIENGAEVDIFFSAAQSNMNTLEDAGLLLEGTRKDIVGNDLVLVVPSDASALSSLEDLTGDTIREIAVGEMESVPAGKYAKQILETVGIFDTVSAKLIQGKDVKETLSYVETGNADAGFVFNTDAASSDKVKIAYDIPDDAKPAILYPAAVVKASKNPDAAKAFMDYLTSEEGLAILYGYAFTPAS